MVLEPAITSWQIDGITDLMDVSLSKLQEFVKDREALHAAVPGVTKSWTYWLEPDMEQQAGSKLSTEHVKAVYFQPPYLTSVLRTSGEMPDWMKYRLESRLLGEIWITSDTQMTPLDDRKWRGTKEPLDEGETRERKSCLKTQHSKN